ncbi:MAG: hypothetical protein ACI8UO_000845 [Verrucomicrobiales bacterium]|jgi:hypothetical protein
MSTLSISLPDSIKYRVERFAQEDGVSIDDFVATVLTRRIAAADADSYLRERANCGSAEKLLELLEKAPDVEPESCDRIDKS